MGRMTEVVKNLIIINVLMYFGVKLLGCKIGFCFDELALWFPGHDNFRPFQFVTHMFMHSEYSLTHLAFNMLSLYFVGCFLEHVWGPKKFLIYYLICGLGAMATHLGWTYFIMQQAGIGVEQTGPMLGASGAVSGCVLAFLIYFWNQELRLLFPPIAVKGWMLFVAYFGFDLYAGLSGSSSGIAHWAHLGGALTGFITLQIWKRA